MAIASVLYVWRPFITELYMALHAEQSNAPDGCVWSRQIEHAVRWLRIFLSGELAGIIKTYSLDVFMGTGPEVVITWDASRYGWNSSSCRTVRRVLCMQFPSAKMMRSISPLLPVQQTWEALCGLICLRLW